MMTQHIRVFISVRNGRAFVSRHIQDTDGSFTWENAINSPDLEAEAVAAITAQGGTLSENGEYDCPPALQARAQWERYTTLA